MNEKTSPIHETAPLPLDWDTPFAELFPTLSLSLDISFLKQIVVPEDFFPEDHISGKLEQNFIYFLLQQTSSKDAPLEVQQEKAADILSMLWQRELSIAISNPKSGFRIMKNYAFYLVYGDLGLEDNLPAELQAEAEAFDELIERINYQVIGRLVDGHESEATIKKLIRIGAASTPNEVLSILEQGPLVENVHQALRVTKESGSKEKNLSDDEVREFVTSNYPVDLNNKQIKIGRITGNDQILFANWETWTDERLTESEYLAKVQELGVEEAYNRTVFSFVEDNNEWYSLQIFNFCQNIPEMEKRILAGLDYLDGNWSDSQKRMLYALGVLAHEFLHRLQTREVLYSYKEVATETWGNLEHRWEGYPSEYVLSYARQEKADEELLLKEDLADSIQIYVMNSSYLKSNYPARFEFIQQKFPHIQPDSAQRYIS